VQRVRERVDEGIAAGQTQSRQEALHPLTRIADQGPPDDPLGRSGVRRDPEETGCAVEPAAVEDRAPVVPEQITVLRIARNGHQMAGDRSGRSWIEVVGHMSSLAGWVNPIVRGRAPPCRGVAGGVRVGAVARARLHPMGAGP
jgi:hypothetical protein